MSNDQETFIRFGKKFQENMCQLMLEDRPFFDQISEVLKIEFFELKYLQIFAESLIKYRSKYNTHPNHEVMMAVLRTELNHYDEAAATQVRNFFARIMNSDGVEEATFVIQEALKLGTDNNFGHNWHTDALKRFEFINRNPISTGWGRMDEIIKGGLGKSELGVVIAPTGAGKSMVLVHLAAEALKAGKTVVYYTLELKDTVVGGRFDSNISGIPLSELKTRKEEVLAEIENVDGSLIIKEYPTKSASVQTIKNHIEKLKKRGIYPDMVLVDYADLLRPDRTTGEKRHELEETYEGLRALAQIYEIPVWTASQTNRSGLNAEVITMESISEAFNKCFVADFIFSLSRTVQDKQSNKGRIFVAKNRNGPDGLVFPCFVDWSDVTIKVLSRDDNDAEMPSTTDALQVLRKKYSELSAK
jgi:hypothetical protein